MHFSKFRCILISLLWMRHKFIKKIPFCLPVRKADDTLSSSLSRARSRRLRLRPWCLEYEASSTFAHLGCYNLYCFICMFRIIIPFWKKSILRVQVVTFLASEKNCWIGKAGDIYFNWKWFSGVVMRIFSLKNQGYEIVWCSRWLFMELLNRKNSPTPQLFRRQFPICLLYFFKAFFRHFFELIS